MLRKYTYVRVQKKTHRIVKSVSINERHRHKKIHNICLMVTKVKNPEIHIKYQHVGSFVHFDGVARRTLGQKVKKYSKT